MEALKQKAPFLEHLQHITRHADEAEARQDRKLHWLVQVPLGLAGSLRVDGPDTPSGLFFAQQSRGDIHGFPAAQAAEGGV